MIVMPEASAPKSLSSTKQAIEQNATMFGSQGAFNASTSPDEDSDEIPCVLDSGRRSRNFRRGHGTGC